MQELGIWILDLDMLNLEFQDQQIISDYYEEVAIQNRGLQNWQMREGLKK